MDNSQKAISEKIFSYINNHQQNYLCFLQKLLSFDSRIEQAGQTGKEGPIQEFIARTLKDMGANVDLFEVDNDLIKGLPGFNPNHDYHGRPNVVGTFKGSKIENGSKSLLFNGHADIVAPGSVAEWSKNPFGGEVIDGRIYSRGAADMKGGLAAALLAIEAIKGCNFNLKNDLIFESVVDEEGGGNGTLACVAKGYKADGAVIMEPTNLEVHAANRGAFLAEFTVTGKPAHASLKGFGINAIEKAFELIQALSKLERQWLLTKRHPLLSNPTINIGQIIGGEGASSVPGKCTVRFDVEFFPRDYDEQGVEFIVDKNQIKQEVETCLLDACSGDSWLHVNPVRVNWYQDTSAFQTDPGHPLVKETISACQEVMGFHRLSGFPAGCDGVYLSEIGKMPVIILGPGNVRQAHTIDEFIELDQFFKAIKVYANLIVRWVGVET
jgi:acetylornithine deacetylase